MKKQYCAILGDILEYERDNMDDPEMGIDEALGWHKQDVYDIEIHLFGVKFVSYEIPNEYCVVVELDIEIDVDNPEDDLKEVEDFLLKTFVLKPVK
jgi:hypothetical protein